MKLSLIQKGGCFVNVTRFCLLASVCLSVFSTASASRYGAMHMTDEQEQELAAWVEGLSLYSADPGYTPAAANVSVLSHFHYTPSLREQAPTGTCWAWTSTAILSMYFDKQFGANPTLQEGLSVQFLATNAWMVGSNLNSGGHYGKTKDFYDMVGYAIPASNTGAAWDTAFGVGETRASLIESGTAWAGSGNTNFPISSITINQIKTWDSDGATKEDAIRNLKSVLDQGYPVGLLYFLPTTADWDTFDHFWANDPETTITSFDYAKGHAWDQGGCGHWVTLVGYNDTDPDPNNHYWLILNSHGSFANRPNVLFRLSMQNIDYSGTFTGNPDGIPYIYCWVKMDTVFAARNSAISARGYDSLSVSTDNSTPTSSSSFVMNGATYATVPPAIVSAKLSLNFLTAICDASTGSWTSTASEFRFVTNGGITPAITLVINKTTKKWSVSVRGTSLARRVNAYDGLRCKLEYKTNPAETSYTLLGQKGVVCDRIQTKSAASVKGP